MKVPKIQTVCGFGCGSSLMLRMNIESIAKKNNRPVVASGPVILLFALLKGCSLFLIHIIEHGGRKSITKVLRKTQTLIMFK